MPGQDVLAQAELGDLCVSVFIAHADLADWDVGIGGTGTETGHTSFGIAQPGVGAVGGAGGSGYGCGGGGGGYGGQPPVQWLHAAVDTFVSDF
jgi:hypothetical protein